MGANSYSASFVVSLRTVGSGPLDGCGTQQSRQVLEVCRFGVHEIERIRKPVVRRLSGGIPANTRQVSGGDEQIGPIAERCCRLRFGLHRGAIAHESVSPRAGNRIYRIGVAQDESPEASQRGVVR